MAVTDLDYGLNREHIRRNTPATPLDEAQQAGFLLAKIPFNKPALSVPDQVALLQQRGMLISDPGKAAQFLTYVGYYRLSGYWFPFQFRDGTANHSNFRPNTDLDTVLDRYIFDRRLRGIAMDAIERIEVAARSALSDVMSQRYGPHWYMDSVHFVPAYHAGFMTLVRRETGLAPFDQHKQTEFIAHYFRTYDPPLLPPSWMVMEILSFGAISKVYKNLVDGEKKSVAAAFGIPRNRLGSWLHAASHLRNLCAHHSRVWNREFGVVPSITKADASHVHHPKKFYNHAVAIQSLLKIISSETHWVDRVRELIADHPNIPIDQMGFPANWQSNAVWA